MQKSFSVDVSITYKKCSFAEKEISEFIKKVLTILSSEELPFKSVQISILITDDSEVRDLNKQYRDKDYATDVLSFAQLEGETIVIGDVVSLGDIVVSYDTAERQAEIQGVSLNQEMSRLLIHGLLHLIGYEHEGVSEDVAQQMFSREDELLMRLCL